MRDIRAERWEARLQQALERVDAALERRHGARYRRHPARPASGAAASPQYDGLFSVAAGFSAGYGSQHGPGYALEIRIATLDDVPPPEREAIEREGVELLRQELRRAFPGEAMRIVRDRHGLKIVGDLRLT